MMLSATAHCVKRVRIRSYSGPHFSRIFRIRTEYGLSVFSPNAEKCTKNAGQNNSEYGLFLCSGSILFFEVITSIFIFISTFNFASSSAKRVFVSSSVILIRMSFVFLIKAFLSSSNLLSIITLISSFLHHLLTKMLAIIL